MATDNSKDNIPTKSAESDVKVQNTVHMEFVDRMWKLPVIQSAWSCSQSTYNKIKDSNSMFNWALNSVEQTVQSALEQAAPIALPVINKLETPIHLADQTLCAGLSTVESYVPQVSEPPCKVLGDAKTAVQQSLQPTLDKMAAAKDYGMQTAHSIKELSWAKANEVLATQYGSMAVSGVESSAALAERLLDYYFPATAEETEQDNAPISPETDKALHTIQTVGRLSNKVARRVYRTISTQIQSLKKEDVQEYVASLMAILQFTQYLNYINQKVRGVNPSTDTKDEEKK